MNSIILPLDFQKSLLDRKSWPSNLIHRSTNTYPSALDAFKSRLNSAELDLFAEGEDDWELPIRDLQTAAGEKLKKYNAHDLDKLRNWLQIQITADPNDPTRQVVSAQQKDPKCRFIYMYGEHSRAPLKLNREMMTLIFTYHQVQPSYLDFMQVFGAQSEARDLRFSGFREQTMISTPARGLRIPELGRSGRQFQLCYNLKSVTLKTENKSDITFNEWSIRQAAIHHQFDVEEGTHLWILTKGHEDLLDHFKELTGKRGRPEDKSFSTVDECFRSSLSAHLMYCNWSTEGWRWYIQWLEEIIEARTAMAIYWRRQPGYAHHEFSATDVQDLQRWADKANEVIMVLESNADVMTSLRQYYQSLSKNPDFNLNPGCGDSIQAFAAQVEDMIYDFRMQISRAKLLVKIVNDRKELILQHLQSQASERVETVSFHMAREAIVMRIVTIVTLIYLPATFVSTFFSTDVVKYQGQDGGPGEGVYSSTAMMRWLQVTLPLTAATLTVAWLAFRYANKRVNTDDLSARLLEKIPSKSKFLKRAKGNSYPLLPLHKGN